MPRQGKQRLWKAGVNAQPGDLGAGQLEGPGAGTGASAGAAMCSWRFAQAEAASVTISMASMAVFIAGVVVLV